MSIRQTIGKGIINAFCKAFDLPQGYSNFLFGSDESGNKRDSEVSAPYKQVSLVFTCIEKIIRAIHGLPLVLSTPDEKIIESGPAWDMLFNNPGIKWSQFVEQTVGHYALSRDVFWVFIPSEKGGVEIFVISGTQMFAVTSNMRADGILLGWEFRGLYGEHAQFAPDEVHQWKNFNPYDRFHGLGPVTAAKLDMNYTFAASLYNSSALANCAEPGIFFVLPGVVTDEDALLFRSRIENRHQGAGKAKRPALLTGGADVKTVAQTIVDMDVANITKLSDNKICSAFGVPPGVAGLITDAQYSHGPAMEDFIFNTVIPFALLFASEIDSGILSRVSKSKWLGGGFDTVETKNSLTFAGRSLKQNRFYRESRQKAVASQKKLFAWFDCSQHPVVQDHDREVADKVLKFTASGVKLNNIIDAYDLPFEQVPWGDDWWIGMGQVPARYMLEAGLEGITGPSLPEGEPAGEEPAPGKAIDDVVCQGCKNPVKYNNISESGMGYIKCPNCGKFINQIGEVVDKSTTSKTIDDPQLLRIWRNWVISWAGIEREYKEALRVFFVRQQRVLIDKLQKALAESKSLHEIRTHIDEPGMRDVLKLASDEIIARIVFDLKIEDGKIRAINRTFFEKASELGIRQVFSEILGLSGDKLNEAVEQTKLSAWLKGKLLVSTTKIAGINKVTQRLVANQLHTGLESGEGLNELTKRIQTVLGGNRARAMRIARTQTAGAVGSGRHAGMKDSGVDLKAWLTSGDAEVREAHKQAGRDYADGIPVDQPFIVAGEALMYPGDPAGSAANIINCRCAEIAKRAAGKEFNLEFYITLQFYAYSNMVRDKVA